MKNKSLVQQAHEEVSGFAQSYTKFCNTLLVQQKSLATISNYGRYFASISLHYRKLAEHLTDDEIESYLATKLREGVSRSLFKHLICGLRSYFRSLEMEEKILRMPKIKKTTSLPVVLSQEECKRLFNSVSDNLKHCVLLSLIYSAGLRTREVINLKLKDIDSDRLFIHIRETKYNKDRYVPLSPHVLRGLRKYYQKYNPKEYLFNGRICGKPLHSRTIQGVMNSAINKARISKKATPHTLRHSYATHLLEMGVNIRQLMDLLGHSDIKSTMVYLHVINSDSPKAFSPFDCLYDKDHGKNNG